MCYAINDSHATQFRDAYSTQALCTTTTTTDVLTQSPARIKTAVPPMKHPASITSPSTSLSSTSCSRSSIHGRVRIRARPGLGLGLGLGLGQGQG